MMMLPDESKRLETLASYNVLDTPEEESFDCITRIASAILQTPIALISLIDGIGDPNIRFYLGVPLRMHNGDNIGTLCTIDTTPRVPTAAQVAMLTDLARLVVDELELRQIAITDSLTGALTRRGLEICLETEIERCRRYGHCVSLIAMDLDHFKLVNDRHGHAAGDLVLQSVVQACRATLRTVDKTARTGGEEFVVVMPEATGVIAEKVAERLRQTVADLRLPFGDTELMLTASFGVTRIAPNDHAARQAMSRADAALYRAKNDGRNRIAVAPEIT